MNLLRSSAGLLWVLLTLAAAPLPAQTAGSAPRLRPPAVPLVTHDPYFSIWSPADKLTDADTVHWTGKPHRLTSMALIDERGFRLMGASPTNVPALSQTGLEVTPTRTIYTFETNGVNLKLTFLMPALPDDLEVLSRPVTYVTLEVKATDGVDHDVGFYLDASPEIVVNQRAQPVRAGYPDINGLRVLDAASVEQPVLQKKGDDLRIDWGHFYVASAAPPKRESDYMLRSGEYSLLWGSDAGRFPEAWALARGSMASTVPPGVFSIDDPSSSYPPALAVPPPFARGELPVRLAMVFHFGPVGTQPVSRWLMLAYDDEFSIKYFGQNLRPYWRRNGDDAAALLKKAAADYESLKARCEKFDAELMADLRKVGGEKYAQLCALAYRQTLAGNKIVADANGKHLMFPKENFSNGCIGTVDVIFPQAPFFLVFSPALTKAMLVPILDYAASPRWPYPYAPHDLGTYPHATGQVYGMRGSDGDRMPVEECGNMLIMLAALAKQQGNADLAKPYWPMLTKWADYLVKEGLDPTNQLCSADMFGHLPRNANLALKAVIGIGAFGQLSMLVGKPDETKKYLPIASDYAVKWQELAQGDGRTVLAYGQPDTWSMKHNLIWDRIVALPVVPSARPSPPGVVSVHGWVFPDSVGDAEVAWYLRVQNPFGLPVDNRTDTSLLDWAVWSIALARSEADFQKLFAPLYRYANETPSRVPLSDWFTTTDARQKGFQARPVVGGIFVKLLADPAMWAKWSQRGADVKGPWAPFPALVPVKEIVPTAQTSPAKWRYTLEQPPADWTKPGFDDSTWNEGTGGFGTKGTPGAIIGTEWNTKQIWLRREFSLPEQPLKNPRLRLIYDEDPEVYLNGVLATKLTGWATDYEEADLAPAALATLKPGRNVLAVRASQTYGGQCIDVGIAADADP